MTPIKIEINYEELDDIELDGIDTSDYPDFCDAFIASATYKNGHELTEEELEVLNEDSGFVYERVLKYIY